MSDSGSATPATPPAPSPQDVLADLTSRDVSRILRASSTINWGSRELAEALAPHVRRIDTETDNLDYAGMLHSNANHVVQAVSVITAAAEGRCVCTTYHGWMFYEPEKLEQLGRVEILSHTEPGWSMTFECRCTLCDATYSVEQGDYHYMWWQWSKPPKAAKRPKLRYRTAKNVG
ncbi:hypothetical protein [Litorihabitans aurantiacus]|uniref:Uncharacterized protein n=1 Tax=Litorihabitans aurantiacus TaxID=1930061 RepID=A0AA37XH51_9MICO|nr:hypothetical protein [Litorihabitans aurantiacus]GMA33451.1 hypothetical protein GCM10025875_34430 [Litorihabitans aurantiacus]